MRSGGLRVLAWVCAGLLSTGCGDVADKVMGGPMKTCAGADTPGKAIVACSIVIESGTAGPGDLARAYMYRGTALHGSGKRAEAIRDLDEAVRLAPTDTVVVTQRGAIRGMQGDDAGAIRDLEKALQLDPRNAVALGNRAIIHTRHGEYQQALPLLERSIAADPTAYQAWAERCWIGAILADRLPETMLDCEQAVRMRPEDANNFNNRGFANYRMQRYPDAIADYDRAIAGDPKVASSFLMRGLAKRAAGMDGAQADIDTANAMDPTVAARYAGYGVKID